MASPLRLRVCPAAPARSEDCPPRRTSSGCGEMRPRCPCVMSLTIVGGIPAGAGRFHARAKKFEKICCSLFDHQICEIFDVAESPTSPCASCKTVALEHNAAALIHAVIRYH